MSVRRNRRDMSRPNKYKARKIETDAGTFDSKLEFKRYLYLKDLQERGLISDLIRQVPYTLIPAQYKDGKCLFRECRDVFKLKQKLMYYFFGIEVKVVKKW